MKYEWRKSDKELYLPKNKPTYINVPPMKYFTFSDRGNPNGPGFKTAIETLYASSYVIRMMGKKGNPPEGYYEYTVFPLEGIWDLDEVGRKLDYLDKDHLVYKIMIRQPDFITEDLFKYAVESVRKSKPHLPIDKLMFEEISEGPSLQMMHLGSYDNEPESFEKMEAFCKEHGYTRAEKTHKEIYITDARKTAPEKQKTVLRFPIHQ